MNVRPAVPTLAIGEIFEVARGGSPRPIEKFLTDSPNGLNWIKISDATASGKFIERTREKIRPEGLSKTRAVAPGDFLLTNSMSFGRPYIMATHGCIHDGWLVLKPRNRDAVDTNFFYHLLGSPQMYRQLSARAGGSTVKNLNSEIVASVEVPLPPLEEQRRIAAILDKADALRAKRKRALALLDTLTQSIFLEMFGDPVSAKVPTVSLASVARFVSGATPSKATACFWGGPHPWVSPKDMKRTLIDSVEDSVTDAALNETSLKLIPTGSVLLVVRGMILAHTVPVALTTQPVTINQDMKAILLETPTDSTLALWNLRVLQAYILGKVQTAAHGTKRLSMEDVENLPMVVPSEIQRQIFARAAGEIASARRHTLDAVAASETLFTSLQSRAFTGQL